MPPQQTTLQELPATEEICEFSGLATVKSRLLR